MYRGSDLLWANDQRLFVMDDPVLNLDLWQVGDGSTSLVNNRVRSTATSTLIGSTTAAFFMNTNLVDTYRIYSTLPIVNSAGDVARVRVLGTTNQHVTTADYTNGQLIDQTFMVIWGTGQSYIELSAIFTGGGNVDWSEVPNLYVEKVDP